MIYYKICYTIQKEEPQVGQGCIMWLKTKNEITSIYLGCPVSDESLAMKILIENLEFNSLNKEKIEKMLQTIINGDYEEVIVEKYESKLCL